LDYFKVLPQNLPGGTETNNEKSESLGLDSNPRPPSTEYEC